MKQIIKEFLKQSNSDLALLLSGEWGIGKTHYIKEKLIPEIELTGKKVFYISLHGVQSINEIFSQIFFQRNEHLQKASGSKYGRIATGVLKSAISIGIKNFSPIKFDSKDNFIKISDITNFENSVIIFDDLERKNTFTDIKNLLGEISNIFISQESVKVIFVANEVEINDKTYHKIKEKIIGWTVGFELSPNNVINSLNEKYKTNKSFFELLENSKIFMVSLVESFKVKNIRSLIFFYNCLEIINSRTKISSLSSNKDIFYSIFVICIEYKKGTFQKFGANKTIPYFISRYKSDIAIPNNNSEDSELEEQFNRYIDNSLMKENNYDFEYFFIEPIFDFVLFGEYNIEKLNLEFQEIEKHKRKNLLSEFSKSCKFLQGCYYLSNKKYLAHLNVVIKTLEKGKLTISEFVLGAKTLCYLSNIRELKLDMTFVEKTLENYIESGEIEEENNYLSNSFIDRYLSEIEKSNERLSLKIRALVNEIYSKSEREEYIEKWKNEITLISDGRTMLKILQYITKEELVNRIMASINNPSFLEHLSFLINRAYISQNSYFPIFTDHLGKFQYLQKELKKIYDSGKYEHVELIWINEFIKEITVIITKVINKTA